MKVINNTSVDYHLVLRCTTQKYAKTFIEKGEIKFNTPQSWVTYEEKHGKGRGDVLEGAFACCNQWDIENLSKMRKRKI